MEPGSKGKKKKFPKSINEMSPEVLQETLKKKKECNAKAQQVVEKLCETHIDEEWFLANLQYINQTHFDDVTIERAITKICGYPLCCQTLEKIPVQQYHISTRYNKVFDITERKNFCSNCCYKSAMYVKKQLFTSPLWFRDQETIPKYSVLKTLKSSMGEEVVLLPDKIKPESDDLKGRNVPEVKLEKNITELEKRITELEKKCSTLKIDEKKNVEESSTRKDVQRLQECKNESNEKVVVKNEDKLSIKNTVKKVSSKESVDPIAKVEKAIMEWFSIDTFFYLHDEKRLKELLSDKAVKIKEVLNNKLSVARQSEKIDKMIKLYGLLDSNYFSRNDSKMNLKPLPDYSVLKEEGKTLEVKVRAFYQGQLEIRASDEKVEKEEEKENDGDAKPTYMPLVHAHAQVALQRKIVLEKLNKLLPDIMRVFSSDYLLQMNEVRNLIATFTLSATNITFKPMEWYLIGIFIIQLLSFKDKHLESILNEESSQNQISLILTSYGLQKNYLNDLIARVNNSSILMNKVNEINR